MSVGVETLFTAALGLQAPWSVSEVDLNTAKRRIDFKVTWASTGWRARNAGPQSKAFTIGWTSSGATWTSSSSRPGYMPRCRV